MHRLRAPLPRLASLSLFTLGAAGAATSLSGCDDDDAPSTAEEFERAVGELCTLYSICYPEDFEEYYGDRAGCISYITGGYDFSDVDGQEKACLEDVTAYIDCITDVYTGCEASSIADANACFALADAIDPECLAY